MIFARINDIIRETTLAIHIQPKMCDFLENNTLECEEPARIVRVKLAHIVNVVQQHGV